MIGRTSKLAIAQIVPKEKNGNPLLMASDATPEAIVIPIYMAELFNAITVLAQLVLILKLVPLMMLVQIQ